MNIYHLTRVAGKLAYDEYDSLIVRASSASAARKLANEQCADEGKIWDSPAKVRCQILSRTGVVGVVLGSFNAG